MWPNPLRRGLLAAGNNAPASAGAERLRVKTEPHFPWPVKGQRKGESFNP